MTIKVRVKKFAKVNGNRSAVREFSEVRDVCYWPKQKAALLSASSHKWALRGPSDQNPI